MQTITPSVRFLTDGAIRYVEDWFLDGCTVDDLRELAEISLPRWQVEAIRAEVLTSAGWFHLFTVGGDAR